MNAPNARKVVEIVVYVCGESTILAHKDVKDVTITYPNNLMSSL